MKPLLDRAHYVSEDILRDERERIFYRQWQFAGVSLQLPKHNDYFLLRVAEKEVIVQNFNGQLSAFTNVCSHRHSAIHTCPRGNRPLQCPYHRWAYDSEGIPRGIPQREEFAELRNDVVKLESLRLERWTLALCGTLIFIRLASDGSELSSYLGDQFAQLEKISTRFECEILSCTAVYQANWKLVLQNTLEEYHVPSVHPATFGKFTGTVLHQIPVSFPHLRYFTRSQFAEQPAAGSARGKLNQALQTAYGKSQLAADEDSTDVMSTLLLLWPAATFGHTNGRAFVLFSYTPISTTQTELRISQWYPQLHDASERDQQLREQFKSLITDFVQQVAEEDRAACEAVQRGITSASSLAQGLIGDHEGMVHQFQLHYLRAMAE